MKSRHCPCRNNCHDAGSCETCDFGKAFENMNKKIKRLKDKNKALEEENCRLKNRIDALEAPDF